MSLKCAFPDQNPMQVFFNLSEDFFARHGISLEYLEIDLKSPRRLFLYFSSPEDLGKAEGLVREFSEECVEKLPRGGKGEKKVMREG